MTDWYEVNQNDGACDRCNATIPAGDARRLAGGKLCLTCWEHGNKPDPAFTGAVHDQTTARLGVNREDHLVARVDFTYSRGTAPSETVMILSYAAAERLRNQLNAILGHRGDACPRCANADHDTLVWVADGGAVRCTNCGTTFRP